MSHPSCESLEATIQKLTQDLGTLDDQTISYRLSKSRG